VLFYCSLRLLRYSVLRQSRAVTVRLEFSFPQPTDPLIATVSLYDTVPSLLLTRIVVNMPYSSRKRPRSDSATKSSSQEPTKKHKQIVVKEGNCTIRGQIFVELGGGLSVFPLQLRKFAQDFHIRKTMQHMNAILYEKTPYKKTSFSIIAGHRERPSSEDYKYNSVAENIPTASIANIKLLQYALSTLPENPEFLELSDVGDLTARDTIFLHSVRLGEMGWAIDRCECVSLYIISRDGAELKELVFFVEEKTQEHKREDSGDNSHKRQQVEDNVDARKLDCDEFEDSVDKYRSEGNDADRDEDSEDEDSEGDDSEDEDCEVEDSEDEDSEDEYSEDEDSEELNEKAGNRKAMDEKRQVPCVSRTSPISPKTTARYCLRSNWLTR
jgi:hypothetical protein